MNTETLTDADLLKAERNLHLFDPEQKVRLLSLLEERNKRAELQNARDHFLPFVKMMWPEFIHGAHHTLMAEAFEKVARGEIKRLAISIGPRHGKSELTSFMLPAWFLGKFPDRKIIQVSNNERLASGFGRKVRNLVGSEEGTSRFSEVFPGVTLAADSKAAASWHTNKGGRYFAVGVSGQVTGEGASIAILDDVHSEQEAKNAEHNPAVFDDVVEWYSSGIRQRLQPGGAIIMVATRWSKRDLIGQVLRRMEDAISEGARPGTFDQWTVIEFPAILDEDTESARPLWPGFWSLDELLATKKAIGPVKWAAQYLQKPTGGQSAIFKEDSWRIWGGPNDKCPNPKYAVAWENLDPPACDYTIHSWDTAIKKNERADYSAMTSWGIFRVEDPDTGKEINNIILLSAFKDRLEFPELKKKVRQFYEEDMPDTLLIEDKGSGSSLIQELRSTGTPVENFSYGRGGKGMSNDKIARANLIADIFASRYVWRPDRRFADEVVLEMTDFPAGEHDDLVDSTVQALIRFRQGGFIRTQNDEDEEEHVPRWKRRYY